MENVLTTTVLSPQDSITLQQTAKWGRFLAIVGFVMVGIMALMSAFIGSLFSRIFAMQANLSGMSDLPPAPAEELMRSVGSVYTVMFLITATLYFVPSLLLYQSASRTLASLSGTFDPVKFSAGLNAQRQLFTFLGVLTIVMLCFYALGLLVFGLIAGFASTY
jgi:uncharacterized membrane protein YjgN (DUF898 family)